MSISKYDAATGSPAQRSLVGYRLPPVAAALALIAAPAIAEEGMWTFDNFPLAEANRTLGTKIDKEWLERVRGASVRMGQGSGGVVSPHGLVVTNEHVIARCVEDLSTLNRNYVEHGFTPASRNEERRCPGLVAEILSDISDVTGRMQAAGRGLEGDAFNKARDAEAARIESDGCRGDARYRCQVVALYRGGQFKLYIHRRYTDVRLAFAPEHRAANFGGDVDNFSFPRFGLDAAFVRLYENNRPVSTPDHLRWNPAPPREHEPVFISGSPGTTQRLLTQDQLRTLAEVILPLEQLLSSELRGRLIRLAEESEENAFNTRHALAALENSYKRGIGRQQALADHSFMALRQRAEDDFRRRVAGNPELLRQIGDPWQDLSLLQPVVRRLYPAYYLLETRAGGGSQLYNWAEDLVRGAQERAKPNESRLPEYGEARLSQIESSLLAERPIHATLEEVQLGWWLAKTREVLTLSDPRVRQLLGDESPEALARRLARNSRLGDVAVRRRLWEGGLAAVTASDDPLVQFVLRIQDVTRAARSEYEDQVQAPTNRASQSLSLARFAVYGTSLYPDATGTLRLSFGRLRGWTYQGRTIPYATTLAGLWERATGAAPFDLPRRLQDARGRLPLGTVYNMTASTDTTGGSSGSPVVNAAGEVIGVTFDSTMLTQRTTYAYDPEVNRSVIVTAQAITEALRHVYDQHHVLAELGIEPAPAPARSGKRRR